MQIISVCQCSYAVARQFNVNIAPTLNCVVDLELTQPIDRGAEPVKSNSTSPSPLLKLTRS